MEKKEYRKSFLRDHLPFKLTSGYLLVLPPAITNNLYENEPQMYADWRIIEEGTKFLLREEGCLMPPVMWSKLKRV